MHGSPARNRVSPVRARRARRQVQPAGCPGGSQRLSLASQPSLSTRALLHRRAGRMRAALVAVVVAITAIVGRIAIMVRLGTVAATAREGCPAQRTEAIAVPYKARPGSRDIRYGVAAEPESIVSARVAGHLSVCGGRIPGHCAGQQSEHHDCCEPKTSGWNISHRSQSSQSCDPPPLTFLAAGPAPL